jgi:hypothetical protein
MRGLYARWKQVTCLQCLRRGEHYGEALNSKG